MFDLHYFNYTKFFQNHGIQHYILSCALCTYLWWPRRVISERQRAKAHLRCGNERKRADSSVYHGFERKQADKYGFERKRAAKRSFERKRAH